MIRGRELTRKHERITEFAAGKLRAACTAAIYTRYCRNVTGWFGPSWALPTGGGCFEIR